ncbi:DUF4097 family beta strand repeat-containing protein [Alloiococcus sp. CFN-8]|uniref:DUF4097 family beta strand repeat-containing protein n=1 Tax=Alloiococcus sp. CFN-8 TaxID=3416081 RepID=UPI003CEAB3BA
MKQWKVGTISLGILLISLGVAWIYSTVTGMGFFNSVFKWWPIVLILLGVEILIFSLIPSNENRRVKVDPLSIIIIILIVIFLGGAQIITKGINYFGSWAGFDGGNFINFFDDKNVNKYSFSESFSAAEVQAIAIDGAVGNVEVLKGDGENITLEVKVSYGDRNKNNHVSDTELRDTVIIENNHTLKISTKKQGLLNDLRIKSIDYFITVPKALNIDIENNIGETKVMDIEGRLDITSNLGDVFVDGIKGEVSITNNLGDTEGHNIEGSFKVRNDAGSILAENISGNADIICRLGEVEAKNIKGDTLIENNSGETVYTAEVVISSKVHITNNLGEVVLNLNEQQEGYFDIKTDLGDISTEFLKDDVQGEISKSLKKTYGNSSASFTVINNSGDIEINN